MGFKDFFNRIWKSNKSESPSDYIEPSPSIEDSTTFYKKSKKLLQQFDEYFTASEAEVESLTIELDTYLEQQSNLEFKLKQLNKPNSWHERYLLLKLDRLHAYSENLKQRIEIYSQNIKVYLNLISKLQNIKAMRMHGISESEMEKIWFEFKDSLEKYKEIIIVESSGNDSEKATLSNLEERLSKLRKTIFPEIKKETEEPIQEQRIRPPIEPIINESVEKSLKEEVLE